MDLSVLEEAGLTEGEIRVYTALLNLGASPTGPIIEKSGVSRSIIYQILGRLLQKGLVSYVTREKTKYFQPSEPDKILDCLEGRRKELEESRRRIENLLPSLVLKQQSVPKNDVNIFRGFKGMIAVHEHLYQTLDKGGEYFFLGIPPEQPKHFHAYWQRDHRRRVKAGIKCKLLFHPKTDRKILINRNAYAGCQARYMPLEINTPVWLMGYKNTVAIGFQSDDPITIEINNEEIANSFRTYFDDFWKRSKPFKS